MGSGAACVCVCMCVRACVCVCLLLLLPLLLLLNSQYCRIIIVDPPSGAHCIFSIEVPPPGLAPCFLSGKVVGLKIVLLAPRLQQQRLPPETSSQFSQDPRSRLRLSHILLRNGAPA